MRVEFKFSIDLFGIGTDLWASYGSDFLIDNSLNLGKVYFDATVVDLQDSLSAFAYKQEPFKADGDTTVWLGTPIDVYFSLDKTLIPADEPAEEEER